VDSTGTPHASRAIFWSRNLGLHAPPGKRHVEVRLYWLMTVVVLDIRFPESDCERENATEQNKVLERILRRYKAFENKFKLHSTPAAPHIEKFDLVGSSYGAHYARNRTTEGKSGVLPIPRSTKVNDLVH
jgi:hypothetical protein